MLSLPWVEHEQVKYRLPGPGTLLPDYSDTAFNTNSITNADDVYNTGTAVVGNFNFTIVTKIRDWG